LEHDESTGSSCGAIRLTTYRTRPALDPGRWHNLVKHVLSLKS
jgi:hypothetical protein